MVRKIDQILEDLQTRMGARTEFNARAYDDLFNTIRDLAERNQLDDSTLRALAANFRAHLDSFDTSDIVWENVDYHTIRVLRDTVSEWKPVKIRALLERMTEPRAVSLGGTKRLTTTLTFRDPDVADSIESIPTVNSALIHRLGEQKEHHHLFDVFGTVVLVPGATGPGERFQLMVEDVQPAESPLQMVRATREEIRDIKRLLRELRQFKKSVHDWILETLVENLGIRGLERAAELRDSLEAVIVQSFSDGWLNVASGKLHTLVIGATAVGKKLLTEAAKRLNPAFQEAHPSKVTAAGVCSSAMHKGGVWISKPGYLPLAHRGVFAIQDFHAVPDNQRAKLLGILNMVMEDGKVIDSTVARVSHRALTSIHLDTNKRSDLFPDSHLRGDTIIAKRLHDIQIPMTILSRFDFIIDIPADPERQMEISLAMYEGPDSVQGPSSPDQQHATWSRQLQVLVAYLRTEHAEVSFPDAIRKRMRAKQEECWLSNADALHKYPWLSDFQARLAHSVFKFVASYARMNRRSTPNAKDVDQAFRLIARKLEFVTTLAKHLKLAKTGETPETLDLDEWLQNRFAGQQITTGEILSAFKETFGSEAVRRTIDRHLPMVARSLRKGVWEFPQALATTSESPGS